MHPPAASARIPSPPRATKAKPQISAPASPRHLNSTSSVAPARTSTTPIAYNRFPPQPHSATTWPRDVRRVAANKVLVLNLSQPVYYGLYFYKLQVEIINTLINNVGKLVDICLYSPVDQYSFLTISFGKRKFSPTLYDIPSLSSSLITCPLIKF